MLDRVAEGSAVPRAFLRIGGMTVARQQAALALQLRCERVICVAPSLSSEMIELQHLVEGFGSQFHVVGQARALVGLVSAVDEVIILNDGLFVSAGTAAELLEEGQAILVQPIEQGLAAGFERIDLNHASAGAMRIPGRLIERVAELPSDCDASSSLLRIALQAGLRQRAIPAPGQDGLFWTLVRTEDEAHALEPQWIRQRTQGEGSLSPSRGLALLAVRSFGPAMLHAGSGARAVAVAAAFLAMLALGSGWFGLIPLAFGFASLGWILREATVLLSQIEVDAGRTSMWLDNKELYGWLIDALLVVLAAWGIESHAGQHVLDRLFPPFMLIALLRILPRSVAPRWAGWFGDRALLAASLAGAILAGFGSIAIHAAAALAALVGILLPLGQSRLTRP
jgi:hypothetical protein